MSSESTSSLALVASLVIHAALLLAMAMKGALPAGATIGLPSVSHRGLPDSAAFIGDTFEIDQLIDERGEGSWPKAARAAARRPDREAEAKPQQPATKARAADKPKPRKRIRRKARRARKGKAARKRSRQPRASSGADAPAGSGSATAAPAAAASAVGGADGGDGAGQGGRYGQRGGRRGVQNLARAFARAVPAAVSADKAWPQLPLGAAGSVEATIIVQQGKIHRTSLPSDTPAHMRRLVRRTALVMRAGTFALSRASRDSGRETLRITVTLSQREPLENNEGARGHVHHLGHDPPSLERAGRAYFTLQSGRHFEAAIEVVSSLPLRSQEAAPTTSARPHAL